MSIKEQLDEVLQTLEEAVRTHLEEERLRIKKLRDKISEAVQQIQVVDTKDKALVEEISDATQKLTAYKPMDIFNELSIGIGGKRMKRSRRSNRGRKSVRK